MAHLAGDSSELQSVAIDGSGLCDEALSFLYEKWRWVSLVSMLFVFWDLDYGVSNRERGEEEDEEGEREGASGANMWECESFGILREIKKREEKL